MWCRFNSIEVVKRTIIPHFKAKKHFLHVIYINPMSEFHSVYHKKCLWQMLSSEGSHLVTFLNSINDEQQLRNKVCNSYEFVSTRII